MNIINRLLVCLVLAFSATQGFAQDAESRWVDSVYNSLTLEQRVGQLICMRANLPDKPFEEKVGKYIRDAKKETGASSSTTSVLSSTAVTPRVSGSAPS